MRPTLTSILTIVGVAFCVLLFDAIPSLLPVQSVASDLLSRAASAAVIRQVAIVGSALLIRSGLLLVASFLVARLFAAACESLKRLTRPQQD